MSSLVIAAFATVLMLGGAAFGIYLNHRVPNEHLTDATKDVVKLSTGIIATIAGLVLSLLIATAKNSYDAVAADVKGAAADFIMLDRALVQLGPDAQQARVLLRKTLGVVLQTNLDAVANTFTESDPLGRIVHVHEEMQREIMGLKLTGSAQEWMRDRALTLASDLSRARWMLQEEESDVLPPAFLGVVVLWLAIIFAGFGLFTPWNPTAVGALIIGAVSISGSLFLINELNTPFYGLVQISPTPLFNSLRIIGPLP